MAFWLKGDIHVHSDHDHDGSLPVAEIVKRCRALGHKTIDTNRDPTWHGLTNEVRCDECGYVYRYDSSG